MKIYCVICAEQFKCGSDISGTLCGHVFHSTCLRQWQENSNTCPQCRTQLAGQCAVIPKLYLDDHNDSVDIDLIRDQNIELEVNLICLTEELNKLKEATTLKDEQLQIAESQVTTANNRLTEVESELVEVKRQLENYDNLQLMLDCSNTQEIDRLLQSYTNDPSLSLKLLATSCAILKQNLRESIASKEELNDKVQRLEKENHEISAKLSCEKLRVATAAELELVSFPRKNQSELTISPSSQSALKSDESLDSSISIVFETKLEKNQTCEEQDIVVIN